MYQHVFRLHCSCAQKLLIMLTNFTWLNCSQTCKVAPKLQKVSISQNFKKIRGTLHQPRAAPPPSPCCLPTKRTAHFACLDLPQLNSEFTGLSGSHFSICPLYWIDKGQTVRIDYYLWKVKIRCFDTITCVAKIMHSSIKKLKYIHPHVLA